MTSSDVPSLSSKIRNKNSRSDKGLYEPFTRDRQIRLVKINHDGSKPHGINLSLVMVDLETAPLFHALSYTWGPAEFDPTKEPQAERKETSYTLHCNNGEVTIRENLFHFLQRICKSKAQGIPHWIDALCINQDNLEERSNQVAFMGDIYMAATKVVVWLGASDPHSDALWVSNEFCPKFVNMVSHLVVRDGDAGMFNFLRQENPLLVNPIIVEQLGAGVCQRWQTCWRTFFEFIATRQWFCRGWVIQEVVLKRGNLVHALSGGHELDWMAMMTFVEMFTKLGWQRQLGKDIWKENKYLHLAIRAVQSFFDIEIPLQYGQIGRRQLLLDPALEPSWNLFGVPSGQQSWYILLSSFVGATSRVEVTDPRDHIYSWIGLASLALPVGETSPIVPNYNAPVEEIFTDFTSILLKNIPLLYPLYTIQDPARRQLSRLPSWVPDYSSMKNFKKYNLISNDPTVFKNPPGSHNPIFFDAPRTSLFKTYRPMVAGAVLTLFGMRIDRITHFGLDIENESFMSSILDLCINLGLEESTYQLTGEHRAQAVLRTLVANTLPIGVEEPDQVEAVRDWILHYCLYLLVRLPKDGDDSILYRRLREQLKEVSKSHHLQTYLPTFEEANGGSQTESDRWRSRPMSLPMGLFCGDRALYQTQKGYIGLGPKSLMGADEVWLLTGSKVPFILRQSLNKSDYYVIGEAYLHGAMHGELMTDEAAKFIQPVRCI